MVINDRKISLGPIDRPYTPERENERETEGKKLFFPLYDTMSQGVVEEKQAETNFFFGFDRHVTSVRVYNTML